MHNKDCFLLGTVLKLYGYKGEVKIYNTDEIAIDFSITKYFLIEINYELVPFFIQKAQQNKQNIILVKFEDIDSELEAKKIQKKKIYVPKDFILKTKKTEDKIMYLIGFSITDNKLGNLGRITSINTQTKQQLIYAKKNGKEFCFPMHEEFVKRINKEDKLVEVNIPEELINLN